MYAGVPRYDSNGSAELFSNADGPCATQALPCRALEVSF
jgi:hypothetical protein